MHDAGSESVAYGEMTWDATVNSELVLKVRTDWTGSMASATPWAECPGLSSTDGENRIGLAGVSSVSPVAHRYIQFRAELSTDDETETPRLTTTTSVKSTYKDYDLLAANLRYPNLTINLTTEYPSVWGNWFTKEFEASGLDGSYYDISVTDKNVEVNLYGYEQGMGLYLEKTEVEVEI
ncbi:MAG: hypothetical protein IBX41_01655 [Methanophagales archaeon]|nr:hypothetical protein [Methanophagales archaeon]